MLKSYLPAKFNTLTVVLFLIFWLFGFYKTLTALLFVYVVLYIVLRRSRNDFRDDPVTTKGVIFSPSNGKIINIEHNVSHGLYGEQLIEIQIMIPWWKEMGISLPLSCEIKNLLIHKGQSFFRHKKAVEILGSKEGKGVSLALDNRGESVGLTFLKCKLGLWPELMVMPGDRGGRRVNIGYFPFGGTVMLYLPKKYEILVKTNDEVNAGETIFAVVPDKT
ncbi:MAG: phosphatidylserine decarboxylase [Bacteriovorax sp.]|jgi:phosphatidylserine decarboxylase